MNKLLKFEKTGCNPCVRMQNYLDSKEIVTEKIMAFDNPDRAGKYDVGSLPTLILVDDSGNEIARTIGYNESEIDDLIAQLK